jgi:3'(2'), 5'-bisphosphate nucleotidase
MNNEQLLEHLTLALQGAVAASEAIMTIYQQDYSADFKADGSPVTSADLASNEVLHHFLEQTGIPLITEESVHAPFDQRENWEYVWCVDPLDGTKEFVKKNDEFAVCIALIHQQRPILGIIASPVENVIMVGGKSVPPAKIHFDDILSTANWQYLEPKNSVNSPLVIAGSRSHHSGTELKFNTEMREQFGEVTFMKKGSALKFFDLALGNADVYARFAPTMEWDIAAGQAIIESLGGTVCHAENGQPLYYNKANLLNPYFIVKTQAVIAQNKL